MKRRIKKAIPAFLATVLLALLLGCGWDNTPQYVIPSTGPTHTPFARWTPSPVPADAEVTATPEPSEEPDATPAGSVDPNATPDPNATATANASATAGASIDPSVSPTPDPYLIGNWEFKRSRHKGREVPASETGQRMIFWLFDNGSAELNIYQISTVSDPPQNTQGVQWRMDGATLIMTLYGETMLTLQYDGTYLILEQEVPGSGTVDMIFEKIGQ